MRSIAAQVLERQLARAHLVLADDQREQGAARVGFFHLRLEAAAARMLHDCVARRAQRLRGKQRIFLGALPLVDHVRIRRSGSRHPAGLLPERNQPFHAGGESHRRRGLAADLLEQAVVAPARADRALRAELVGDPLEHGEVVVVEAPHEPGVDRERDARHGQQFLQALEVRERRLAEENS